ncbi:hypothetical protein DRQ53_15245 [bacterium]|nr:MAG: hypothetical protein DRQ53_15245 [bacterium]
MLLQTQGLGIDATGTMAGGLQAPVLTEPGIMPGPVGLVIGQTVACEILAPRQILIAEHLPPNQRTILILQLNRIG